ncbi:MAG: glycosyltransferase [Promethearchaeota archaeon]|nr:MAG: glycosyltransferase [Candidatus Lokiarchaeota archaeon]
MNVIKPRILMVSYPFDKNVPAGGSLQAIRLSKEIIKKLPVIAIGSSVVKGNRKPALEFVEGIPTYRIYFDAKRPRVLRTLDLLILMIKIRNMFDIVHFHGFDMYPICIFAKLILRKKTIVKITLNGQDDPLSKLNRPHMFLNLKFKLRAIKLFLYNHIDKVITISDELYYNSRKVFTKSKLERIPNGVDVDIFCEVDKKHKNAIRKSLRFKNDDKIALYVGHFGKRKGIPELVEAWKYVDKAKLILLGTFFTEGFDSCSFNLLINQIKKNENVITFPYTNNPVEFYQIADLFVFPSKREGLPNAILEAMSCNLPILAFNGSWTKGFLNSNNCILIDELNPRTIAEEVNCFFKNHHTHNSNELKNQTRTIIEKDFALSSIAENFVSLYRELFVE